MTYLIILTILLIICFFIIRKLAFHAKINDSTNRILVSFLKENRLVNEFAIYMQKRLESELGEEPKEITSAETSRMMYDSGRSVTEISKQRKLSKNTVYSHLRKTGK